MGVDVITRTLLLEAAVYLRTMADANYDIVRPDVSDAYGIADRLKAAAE